METKKKVASKAVLALLLVSVLTLAFDIQPSMANGTIYIWADGSIEGTTQIVTSDRFSYVFTADIIGYIVVERSNIIIDGQGHTVEGMAGDAAQISLYNVNNVTIKATNINGFQREWGITLSLSSNCSIHGNNITNNYWGIYLYYSSNNSIYHNNFINNTEQIHNIDSMNTWDDGYPSGGNYWNDYVTRYPVAQELDDSGTWDTPYNIDENNQDNYPLTKPWSPAPPTTVPASPYIKVMPEETVNPALTVGMNYTVAIVTDYTGNDIWAWQFSLTYNPNVLHGGVNLTDVWTGNSVTKVFYMTRMPIMPRTEKVYLNGILKIRDTDYAIDNLLGRITFRVAPANGAEIRVTYVFGAENGDLITRSKHSSAQLILGQGFNNTAGGMSLLGALFFYITPSPPATTSGPGTLAYVTFTVVGTGCSNINLGIRTNLLGWNQLSQIPPEGDYTTIIDAETMPDHIGHSLFDNRPHKVKASVHVDPGALNLKSKGKWITSYIQLPEGYAPADIDATTILLNNTISPVLDPKFGFARDSREYLVDHNSDGVLERMVKFDRAAVESLVYSQGIRYGNVALTITGEMFDGTPFEGKAIIFVNYGGDVNSDGTIDVFDILKLKFHRSGPPSGPGGFDITVDINNDGTIDVFDILIGKVNLGQTVP